MAGGGSNPYKGISDASSHENALNFALSSLLSRVSIVVPVKIMAVKGGGVGPAGTVDVQPMIKMVDGVGKNPTSHGKVSGIPWIRGQGSGNVIINDPVVGDVGLMVCAHRDISSFKANGGSESVPGSRR